MPKTEKSDNTDGLSHLVNVAKLPKAGLPIRFSAKPEECAAVARRLDIPAVSRLEADVLVESWRAEGVKITGRLVADVVQTDVVTLEPLPQTVDEPIDRLFVPEQSRLARLPEIKDGELHLDPEGDDIPDTFTGERIDLGELLTELLALGLNPYPRAATARFSGLDTDPEPEAGRVSPFAELGRLKPDP